MLKNICKTDCRTDTNERMTLDYVVTEVQASNPRFTDDEVRDSVLNLRDCGFVKLVGEEQLIVSTQEGRQHIIKVTLDDIKLITDYEGLTVTEVRDISNWRVLSNVSVN